MLSTLCLASFDPSSRSASGFLLRYVVPRAPVALYGKLAHPAMLRLIAPRSDLIIGTGHGAPDEYSAQDESVVWKVGEYDPAQVKGKIVKLLACESGRTLGPDLVNNGALAFLGYDDDYLWLLDESRWMIPWSDPVAAPNLMPVMAGLNALLDGAKASEALAVEKAGYLKNAEDADFEMQRDLLLWDNDHAVLFGDENARISPRPHISLPFPPPPLLV